MDRLNVQNGLYDSFGAYYNVKTEDVEKPFSAEAVYHSDDSMYFLIKAAKMSESYTHEYVYFADVDVLDEKTLTSLDEIAWERGLANVNPGPGHHCSDVALIIIADRIEESAARKMKEISHHKSYRFMLWGYSNYRLVAIELSSGNVANNRQGKSLKKLVCKVLRNF